MPRITITSRSDSKYMLSKILKNRNSNLWKIINAKNLEALNDTEKECLRQFENLATIKASKESLAKFNEYKMKITFSNLEELTNLARELMKRPDFTFQKIFPWTNSEKVSRDILKFYNFLSNFLNPNDLVILFFKFSIGLTFPTLGEVYSGNNHQCVRFTHGWDTSLIQSHYYQNGYYSAPDYFSTFVHEFCHGIIYFLKMISSFSKSKSTFNRHFFDDSSKRYETCKELIQYIKSLKFAEYSTAWITESYINYITKEGISKEINDLFPKGFNTLNVIKMLNMTAVPSNYGRENYNKQTEEIMCEAFVYWYFTLEEERNYYWQLIHDYFSKVIWDQWYKWE